MRRRLNNFGDLIGPVIVEKMLSDKGITSNKGADGKLLSVGSVLHFADSGDHVWGTGVNGKVDESEYHFKSLDVRSVRGPKTRNFLLHMGIDVPEVYGDPALLLPDLYPELVKLSQTKKRELCVLPNFNDYDLRRTGVDYVNPRDNLWRVIEKVVTSEFVIGSSLHAIVVAEAFGIPCRRIISAHESDFKYEDYYLGTGRQPLEPAASEAQAHQLGGGEPLRWDSKATMDAFPYDLFTQNGGGSRA